MRHFPDEVIQQHYSVHADKPFYGALVGFMTSGPVVAIALEGKDAIAKAEQFASLTGVSVGDLMFISEVGGGVPVVRDLAQVESMAMAKAAPPTSISGGQLEISLNVQAVFAIQ